MGIPVIDRFDGDMSAYTRKLCEDNADVPDFWSTVSGEARMRSDNEILTRASVAYRLSNYTSPWVKLRIEAKSTPIGIVFNAQNGQNCYVWVIEKELTGDFLRLYKVVAGVVTLVKELSIVLPSLPTYMYMKISRVAPPNFYIKIWEAGSPEPETWTDSATDSAFSSGEIGLFAGWLDWDNLEFSDNMDWATQEFPETSEEFYEDFGSGDWLGEWPGSSEEFYDDFESADWLGEWPGSSSEFYEDFESWGGGPT